MQKYKKNVIPTKYHHKIPLVKGARGMFRPHDITYPMEHPPAPLHKGETLKQLFRIHRLNLSRIVLVQDTALDFQRIG